jgi:hypothetical protein
MDHPMIGAERFEAVRRTAYVPPVSVGGSAVRDRLDRHFSVLAPEGGDPDPEPSRLGVAQTTQLLREITPRPSAPTRRRLWLHAPLRSFKRWIGF